MTTIKRPKSVGKARYCNSRGVCCAVGAIAYGSGLHTKTNLATFGKCGDSHMEYRLETALELPPGSLYNLRHAADFKHWNDPDARIALLDEFVDTHDAIEWAD
jgi:hypothetical protein